MMHMQVPEVPELPELAEALRRNTERRVSSSPHHPLHTTNCTWCTTHHDAGARAIRIDLRADRKVLCTSIQSVRITGLIYRTRSRKPVPLLYTFLTVQCRL